MKIKSLLVVSIISFFCAVAFAEDPVTGLCKDGTPYTGKSKRGACRGHDGVKEWYGESGAPAPAANATTQTAAPAANQTAPATANAVAATGLCKDGTPYTGQSKRGACRGHDGLKEWYADKPAAAAIAPAPAAASAQTQQTQQAQTKAPVTGICKDGTEYTGASKRGACRGHDGVKEWFADKPAAAAIAPAPAAASAQTQQTQQTQTKAPVTGICKDGTEYTGASKRGACRGHDGVKEWFADKPANSASVQTQPAPAQIAAPAPVQTQPALGQVAAPASNTATPSQAPAQIAAPVVQSNTQQTAAVQAPAAGTGKVWVNTHSKIYHCEGSKFYGKTKQGEYMNEADAQTKGFVANRKKICNK